MKIQEKKIDKLIVIGDRVLIKPKTISQRTKTGLYLPPGVKEKEQIQSGYVIKVGPGYPIPFPGDADEEVWKKKEDVKYIPLQVQEGDMAIYLQKHAFEIEFEGGKYFIVPHSAILVLFRDEGLFE